MIESGFKGFEVTVWSGVCAPAGVPKPIIANVNADLGKVLAMPNTQKRYAELGADVMSSSPEQVAAFIKAENAKWAKTAKGAGIQPQ
jgi:tripartite-type tricarboxylate transporter receptor subunit TctC